MDTYHNTADATGDTTHKRFGPLSDALQGMLWSIPYHGFSTLLLEFRIKGDHGNP